MPKILVCKTKDDLRPPEELASYDVVIITTSILQHEAQKVEDWYRNLASNKPNTVLMQVMWYRVIVDEGCSVSLHWSHVHCRPYHGK